MLATLFFATAVMFLGVVLLATWLWPDNSFEPLGGYNNPQPIQNDGPFPVNGFIEVIAIKCNVSDEAVAVSGRSEWQQLGEGQRQIPYRMGAGEFFPAGFDLTEEDRARGWDDDGCRTTLFRNDFPVDHPSWGPGIWVLEGNDTAQKNGSRQTVHWETEPFEVVP